MEFPEHTFKKRRSQTSISYQIKVRYIKKNPNKCNMTIKTLKSNKWIGKVTRFSSTFIKSSNSYQRKRMAENYCIKYMQS